MLKLIYHFFDKSILAPDWVEIKMIKITRNSRIFFQQGILLSVYFYLHSKVEYLCMGVIKDPLWVDSWTTLSLIFLSHWIKSVDGQPLAKSWHPNIRGVCQHPLQHWMQQHWLMDKNTNPPLHPVRGQHQGDDYSQICSGCCSWGMLCQFENPCWCQTWWAGPLGEVRAH